MNRSIEIIVIVATIVAFVLVLNGYLAPTPENLTPGAQLIIE